jgi:hypothetical protein
MSRLLLPALVTLLPALCLLRGSTSGQPIALNLGPGDSAFITGFARAYETVDGVATQWTSHESSIALPLTLAGPAQLVFRYARIFPQTAQVSVTVGATDVDRFPARGGAFLTRRAPVYGTGAPIVASFHVTGDGDPNLGLKLDWVRLEPAPGSRIALAGPSRWRGVLLVALVLLVLRLAGWSARAAAFAAAPLALLLSAGLWLDPWLTHRLLTGVPETYGAVAVVGLALAHWLRARRGLALEDVQRLALVLTAALLLRAAAVNHPDFYYPDLRTHARLVETVRAGGLDFFRSPAKYIWEHGVWRTQAYGQTYAFPYSPAFHLAFVPLALEGDALESALKLFAAAISLVPLVVVWALARRVGVPPLWPALLMVAIPTYTSRLTFAFMPALFGHAFDMLLVLWLCTYLSRLGSPRTLIIGAALVAACQLAYVSGINNTGALIAALALAWAWDGPREGRVRRAALVLGMGLAGAFIAVALYYRDFFGLVSGVIANVRAGTTATPSHYPVQSFWSVAYGRTLDFFGWLYPPLAVIGFARLLARCVARPVLIAWALGYLLLLVGRARMPDIFLHGHETLLITPLVCLAAGEALAALANRGRSARLAAIALLAVLAVQGLWLQWQALRDQLANAL